MQTSRLVPIGFFVLAAILQGCGAQSVSSAVPTPTLTDPHHHVVDVSASTVLPEMAEELAFVEVALDPQAERFKITANSTGTYQAFCIDEILSNGGFRERLIVEDLNTGRTYEVQGLPLPWRDFSSLVWMGDILVFDKWSQPHHGLHYAVDVQSGTLIQAAPFPDQLPGADNGGPGGDSP
jgi:hypothetical protein